MDLRASARPLDLLAHLARTLRILIRGTLVLGLLLATLCDGWIHTRLLGMTPGPEGALWVHHWCRRLTWALGIEVCREGPIPEPGNGMLAVVANHLSYLDVLLFSAIRPFTMVSKTEVRDWPLLGWITAQAGTIYVQRADAKAASAPHALQTHAQVNAAMARAFRDGLPVLFFPEGTTTDGTQGVLPFRRGLFNSIVHDDVPLTVATVAYEFTAPNPGASVADKICFWGDMSLAPHLLQLLGLRGVKVTVRFAANRIPGRDRFTLASTAYTAIAEGYEDLLARQGTTPATQQEAPTDALSHAYRTSTLPS